MSAKRYELAVATVLLGGVALAGCSQQSAVSPATTGAIAPSSRVPTAPPSAPVTAPSSTATAPPSAPTSADVVPVASPADTPLCTTAQLSASLVPDRGGASAGHFAVWLRVQNTSSRVCRIDGYGGVSLVGDNNGTQLGAPADRTPTTVTPTILISGAHAQELLQITQPGDYGAQCHRQDADGVRLYPPEQTSALFAPYVVHTCSNPQLHLLQIGPFQPIS